jgi:hypothetical protein
MVEDLLLTNDHLLLARPARGGNRRDQPILAYCPGCLATDASPYFRRRWRFAPFVVCLTHHALLLDCRWRCRARVDGLTPSGRCQQPRCGSCGALLCEAPAMIGSAAVRLVPRQRNLEAMLAYLATNIAAGERGHHLDRLTRVFRPQALRGRAAVVAGLRPGTASTWFGLPIDPRHCRAALNAEILEHCFSRLSTSKPETRTVAILRQRLGLLLES